VSKDTLYDYADFIEDAYLAFSEGKIMTHKDYLRDGLDFLD
jgi:hypothetical protein